MGIVLLILVLLIFGGGGFYVGHANYGPYGGPGFGLGTILVILLVLWALGLFRNDAF